MKPLVKLNGIRYGLLQDQDLEEMAQLIGEAFSHSDPLGVAAGMSADELAAFVRLFSPKAVAEGLTVIARDASGRLIGAMFSDDLATPPPDGLETLPASFAPVGALLETLGNQYHHSQVIVPGSHAHLNMLAVLPSVAGRGIAQGLVRVCLENAAARGYRIAVTEANGRVSQHIFRKLGFRECFKVSYSDFVFDGQRVFAPIVSHGGAILMEANLGKNLKGQVIP